MAGNRYTIWALDNLISLEGLLPLLKRNYDHEIEFLINEDIDERDKVLYNKWLSPDHTSSLEISVQNVLGRAVRYIHALGKYEYGLSENKSFVNHQILPREVRIFNHISNVLFFEFEQRVYSVVEISESQGSRIRSALFGQRPGNKMEEWGSIEYKQPLPFIFDSRFYYWLLSKKGTTFALGDKNVEILDVSAISLLSERNVYESNSQGPNLLNGSLSALSGLGSNESVHLVGLKLKIGTTTLNIQVSKNGVTYIDKGHCYISEENDIVTTFNENCNYFLLLIYETIFSELLLQYETDKNSGEWDTSKEAIQRKKWALIVIRNLIEQNDITIEELSSNVTVTEVEAV